MMRLPVLLFAVFPCLGLAADRSPSATSPNQFVVREGQAQASISVAPDANEQVRNAALLLQEYIRKSTGADLPLNANAASKLTLHVGETEYVKKLGIKLDGLDEDGFVLKRVDTENYLILGGGPWGTEFGVYEFLERFVGVRWYLPGEEGEIVPQRSSLELPPSEIRQNPVYLGRTLSPLFNPIYKSADNIWARRNRIRPRLMFNHNLNHLFPPSIFAASRPDFYPMLDGKRFLPPNDKNIGWNPNFIAPGIVEAAIQRIDEYFQKHPEADSYSLSTNDTGNFDESPENVKVRGGGRNFLDFARASNEYFPWANAVVEGVRKTNPGKWFGTLAYRETLEPPTNMTKLDDHLVPVIAYERMQWANPVRRKRDQELVKQWGKLSSNLGWWDYAYGINYLVPRVYPRLMGEYLLWGSEHGVRFYHGELYPNWGEGPKGWILTRLLWNPRQDVGALLDEWYGAVAGQEAAPKLKAFYEAWEKFWTVDVWESSWVRSSAEDGGTYLRFDSPEYLLSVPQKLIDQSEVLMNEAVALAQTPRQKQRVERLRKMWEFSRASITLYQTEMAAASDSPATEEAALDWLRRSHSTQLDADRRLQLLRSFDRFQEGRFSPYVYIRPQLLGINWGNSLLWKTFPWISKSPRVRSAVEELARDSNPRLQRNAELLLKMATKSPTQLLKNPSFEEGLSGWNAAPHRLSFGNFALSKANVHSGTMSLRATGVKRGSILQRSIPWKAGSYFVSVSGYVPKNFSQGKASLRFWWIGKKALRARDVESQKYALALPMQEIPLRAGEWTTLSMPFELQADDTISELQVDLAVTNFPNDGDLWVDDIELWRLEE